MLEVQWTHYATLPETIAGVRVLKEFRWRVEMFDGHPRVVAEHRTPRGQVDEDQVGVRFWDGWHAVRWPERLAQLLAMTQDEEQHHE